MENIVGFAILALFVAVHIAIDASMSSEDRRIENMLNERKDAFRIYIGR